METFTDSKVKNLKVIHINLSTITKRCLLCIISVYVGYDHIAPGAAETHQICLA